MYKDKDKQAAAAKRAKARYLVKNKGILKISEIKTLQDCAGGEKSGIPVVEYPAGIPSENTLNGIPSPVEVLAMVDRITDHSDSFLKITDITGRVLIVLTDEMLSRLPANVARPYSGRTLWTNTVEYSQTIYNLLTRTVEQLQAIGQFIPCWKLQGEQAQ